MKSAAELAAEQAAFWNGPGGQGWLAAYERIDRSIGDLGRTALALANAQHGERVVDVGCGTGGTTAALSHSVGLSGHVLGIDISEPHALVRGVEKFVYGHVPYAWDWDTWGVADYLPSVAEVRRMGREDCDGRAVVVPYPPYNVRVFDERGRIASRPDFPRMQVRPQWPREGELQVFDGDQPVLGVHLGPSLEAARAENPPPSPAVLRPGDRAGRATAHRDREGTRPDRQPRTP